MVEKQTLYLFLKVKVRTVYTGREKAIPFHIIHVETSSPPFTLASFMGLNLLISHDECTRLPTVDYKERPIPKTGYQ